ncbi:MAG: hypothetical protein J7J91_00940 [Deltaproteobacteria bacterium]|nr:hypothetical protein [Deltaproteobacteria bacterium]
MHKDKEVLEKQIELERVKLERTRYEVLKKFIEILPELEKKRMEEMRALLTISRQRDLTNFNPPHSFNEGNDLRFTGANENLQVKRGEEKTLRR